MWIMNQECGLTAALHGGGAATSSHGVVLGWPQQSALGTRAEPQALPGHTPGLVGPGQPVLQAPRGWRCRT